MRRLYVLLFLMVVSFAASAQQWELGGSVGASGYMGDFNEINPVKFTDPSLGLFVKYNFSNYFSVKLGYTYATIRGADSTSSNQNLRNRNLSFISPLNEASLTGELNFFDYQSGITLKRWTPFIFSGVALVNFDPKANYNGSTFALRPLKTEGEQKEYPGTVLSIPYGAGVKVNFYKSWNASLELGYRTAFTGYLDDVSGNYANKADLINAISQSLSDRSGEKTGVYSGTAGTQRGNFSHRDTYMIAAFSISFTFLSEKCPVVQR